MNDTRTKTEWKLIEVTFLNKKTKQKFVNYGYTTKCGEMINEIFKAMKRKKMSPKEWRATFHIVQREVEISIKEILLAESRKKLGNQE